MYYKCDEEVEYYKNRIYVRMIDTSKLFKFLAFPLQFHSPVGTRGIYHLPFTRLLSELLEVQSEIRMEKYGVSSKEEVKEEKNFQSFISVPIILIKWNFEYVICYNCFSI